MKNFYHTFKKKFHDVNDRNDDSYDDSNNVKEFDAGSFMVMSNFLA